MKKSKIISKILITIITFMFFMIPIYAAEGTITIELKELETNKKDVVFELYHVGKVDEKGAPVIDPIYGNYDSFEKAEEVETLVKELCGKVKKEPEYRGKTNNNGALMFSQLEEGVYLVIAKEMKNYGEIQPFLVMLPYYQEVHGKIEGPLYQIRIEPKASKTETEEPSKPNDPKDPEDITHTNDSSGIERYMYMMAGSGMLCILIIFISIRRKGNGNEAMEKQE